MKDKDQHCVPRTFYFKEVKRNLPRAFLLRNMTNCVSYK